MMKLCTCVRLPVFSLFLSIFGSFSSALCVTRPTFIGNKDNTNPSHTHTSTPLPSELTTTIFRSVQHTRQHHSISNRHVFRSICFDDILLSHIRKRDTTDRKKERSSTKCSHLGPVQSCIFSSLSGDQIKTNWLHLLNIRRNWNRLLQYLTRSSVASAFLLHSRLFFLSISSKLFHWFSGLVTNTFAWTSFAPSSSSNKSVRQKNGKR